jgi:DNA-binding GntR family transcriptional regulator
MLKAMRLRLRFYHRSSLYQLARLKASFYEHARVMEAIKSGDEGLAQRTMREHVLFGGRVFADLITNLSNRKP